MDLARRAILRIKYRGQDITSYLDKQVASFSYNDCAKGEADTISISLEDSNNKWINGKLLEKYDRIVAEIKTINWNKIGVEEILPCGEFLIDEPSFSGPPDVVNIEAISKPSNTNFTETKRSKAWINVSIKEIVKTISNNNGLYFFYDALDILINNIEQNDIPDMSFLSELCESYGLAFKLTDETIVIFSEKLYESKSCICTIYKSNVDTISYSFKSSLTNTAYDTCVIKYLDNNMICKEYQYSVAETENNKETKVYKIDKVANTYAEAEKLAIGKLRQLNKKAVTGSITVVGNIKLLAGLNVNLSGFGKFDGKYYIDKTTHELPNYNTTIELHKCLEGY